MRQRPKIGQCSDCGGGMARRYSVRCLPCFRASIHKGHTRREYARWWQVQRKYGITQDEFWAYWQACRGKCWICERDMIMPTETRGQGLRTVSIDHDHKTGRVRGLLCSGCNKALGLLDDDIGIIRSALKYLSQE